MKNISLQKQISLWNNIPFLCLILFISAFLIYINSLSNQFAFDDKGLILENKYTIEGTDLKEIFTHNYRYGAGKTSDGLYRPLVNLSYVLNGHGEQPDPKPYHFFNILFNAFNSVLLFFIVKKLTGKITLAFISSLIFSLHPIHTESVANIAGRPEILFCFFLFLSWISFIYFKNVYLSVLLSTSFLLLGLLSKETAIVLPIIIILSDLIIRKGLFNKEYLLKILVLFFISGLYLLIRWLILNESSLGNVPNFYDNQIFASNSIERISTALSVLFKYLTLLIFPLKMSSDYSYMSIPTLHNIFNPYSAAAIIIVLVLFYISFNYFKSFPELLIGLAIFTPPYLLVSNILFPIGTIAGERFMYLPLAGVSLILGSLFMNIIKINKIAGLLVLSIFLTGYSARTLVRNTDWYDDYSITKKDLSNYPSNVKLLLNMGILSAKKGDMSLATELYSKALSIYPEFTDAMTAYGKLEYDRKNFDSSIEYYSKAAIIKPESPQIIFDYASVLINSGQFEKAENLLFEKIIKIPSSPLLYQALGNLMIQKGKFNESIEYYEKSLKLGGNTYILLTNMAAAAIYQHDYSLAYSFVLRAEKSGLQLNSEMVREIMRNLHLN